MSQKAVEMEVKGSEAVLKKLKELGTSGKKIMRKSFRKGAKIVRAEAAKLAPVGKTKRLKKNVKVRSMKRSRTTFGIAVQNSKGDFKGTTFYSGMVNWGTQYQEAQRFMDRAYETKGKEAGDIIIADLWQQIKSIAT